MSKGLSERKIDILIGQFGRLVTAIESITSTESDGLLKTAIDYAFAAFDKSVVCATDVSVQKAMNRIEKSLPGFDVFRSEHAKACKGETLIPYGSGGLLDRLTFERCVVKQITVTKPVKFTALSSAYSGLKEVANAGYCAFQRQPENAEERMSAEANFAATSVLLGAYSDLGTISGCSLSTPRMLYDCSRKYGVSQTDQIKSAHPEDNSSIDLQVLGKKLSKLVPPETRRNWNFRNFDFSSVAYLPIDTLEGYEDAISAFRRSAEVVSASKALRQKAYRKEMDALLTAIAQVAAQLKLSNEHQAQKYISCASRHKGHCMALDWVGLKALNSGFEAAASTCSTLLQNQRFSDHVQAADRNACNEGSALGRKRITEVLSYFAALDKQQREGSKAGLAMDRAPK